MSVRLEGCWRGWRGVGKVAGVLARLEGCWRGCRGVGKVAGVLARLQGDHTILMVDW